MGNCHCGPREDSESLREYLARKFRISGKSKIDDRVTIANQHEKGKAVEAYKLPLDLTDFEDDESDSDSDNGSSDSDSSSVEERIFTNLTRQKQSQINEDFAKKTETIVNEPSSTQEEVQHKEDSDFIRVLQQQLMQVQSELAKAQRTPANRNDPLFNIPNQSEGHSDPSTQVHSRQSDDTKVNVIPSREIASPNESISSNNQLVTTYHAQGDAKDRPRTYGQVKEANDFQATYARNNEMFAQSTIKTENDNKSDSPGTNEKKQSTVDCKRKMQVNINEGLTTETAGKLPRNKAKMKTAKVSHSAEDREVIEEKIAKLQKRDPTLPRPDKGIVYPKTISNLGYLDKTYYVEQFLRSELFRQRCLRKYQGSTTWMNGLSPFQLWVLENEGTAEIEDVLHPLAKHQNNAKAKVKCWTETLHHRL